MCVGEGPAMEQLCPGGNGVLMGSAAPPAPGSPLLLFIIHLREGSL